MKQTAQWNLTVTADLERRTRRYLDSAGRKGELSAFVEEAVRARLLQLSMRKECILDQPGMPTRGRASNDGRVFSPVYKKPSANDVESAAPEEKTASVAKLGDGSYRG